MVKINHISDGNIYAKLENRNPAMSVKCRIGTNMVAMAERDGSLRPGMPDSAVLPPVFPRPVLGAHTSSAEEVQGVHQQPYQHLGAVDPLG